MKADSALTTLKVALLLPVLLAVGVATANPAAAHAPTPGAIAPYTYGGVGYAVGSARHDAGVLVDITCAMQKRVRHYLWGYWTWQTATSNRSTGYGYAKAEARSYVQMGVLYRTQCTSTTHGGKSTATSVAVRLA